MRSKKHDCEESKADGDWKVDSTGFLKCICGEIKGQGTNMPTRDRSNQPPYPDFMTAADVLAYKGQKKDILHELAVNFLQWVSTETLEEVSGSKRVAARILTLRDDMWDIAVRREEDGRRGEYMLRGKVNVREKRKHCPSCQCNLVTTAS